MSWEVVYSAQAKHDLREIYQYISFELCDPQLARTLVRKIMENIHALQQLPLRHQLYFDEPWYSRGVRFFPVNHYLIFYLPAETNNTVKIIRIMYGGREITKQLAGQE